MYKILKKEQVNPNTILIEVMAPKVAKAANPGQFVILRTDENGERIPFTIADYDSDKGTITIIFQVVGATTKKMSTLNVGDSLATFAGPLGEPSHLNANYKMLCIGGGVGTAVVYPMIKKLSNMGSHVDVIIGARNKEYIILEDEIKAKAKNLYISTDDGSKGQKGFVTDILKKLLDNGEKYDEVIVIGPLVMMKYVSLITKEYGIKTVVSMNPIMVDGTGMCGGCRVTVGGEIKYACVDGPDFDGHLVDFDEAMNRQNTYKEIEEEHSHKCKGGLHNV